MRPNFRIIGIHNSDDHFSTNIISDVDGVVLGRTLWIHTIDRQHYNK